MDAWMHGCMETGPLDPRRRHQWKDWNHKKRPLEYEEIFFFLVRTETGWKENDRRQCVTLAIFKQRTTLYN